MFHIFTNKIFSLSISSLKVNKFKYFLYFKLLNSRFFIIKLVHQILEINYYFNILNNYKIFLVFSNPPNKPKH